MKIEFLKEIKSLVELKKAYQKLCFKFHPDRGGDTEKMQTINAEYDYLLKILIDSEDDKNFGENAYWESREHQTEVEKAVKEKLHAISNLDGIEIEVIGVWIWVGGDTKQHKERLKELGFKWIQKHSKWCFMGKKSQGRGGYSMNQMREKHGAKVYGSARKKADDLIEMNKKTA